MIDQEGLAIPNSPRIPLASRGNHPQIEDLNPTFILSTTDKKAHWLTDQPHNCTVALTAMTVRRAGFSQMAIHVGKVIARF
jgi:hypothetical protein